MSGIDDLDECDVRLRASGSAYCDSRPDVPRLGRLVTGARRMIDRRTSGSNDDRCAESEGDANCGGDGLQSVVTGSSPCEHPPEGKVRRIDHPSKGANPCLWVLVAPHGTTRRWATRKDL